MARGSGWQQAVAAWRGMALSLGLAAGGMFSQGAQAGPAVQGIDGLPASGALLPTAALVSSPQSSQAFEALVACRTRLADLEWSQRIWPDSNPEPKPPRSQTLPDSEIRRQVDDLLRKESALRALYGVELDAKALQTEMNRMSVGTRAPDRLREQYRLLHDDPEVVANCVARPLLIVRRLREGHAFDARWHGELKQRAVAALAAGAGADALAASGAREQTLTLVLADEEASGDPVALKEDEVQLPAEAFARERDRLLPSKAVLAKSAAEPPLSEPGLRETAEAFLEETVLEQAEDRLVVRSRVWAKQPFEAWWSARRAAHAPASAWKQAGSLSLPAIKGQAMVAPEATADSWRVLPADVPEARFGHTAVWTGSEMIVWGGAINGLAGEIIPRNTGGRYDPATDSWTPTTTTGAPAGRLRHTAIWTGSEMIVWGGSAGSTGGRYNPATDSWTATTTSGAPIGRDNHTAIWTGSEMIVWGGSRNLVELFSTGGRYHPATDSWTAMTTTGVPSARDAHTAVWTGSEMIVWGGNPSTGTGGRYQPATDSWTATATSGAPSARARHTAVWTGSEMIVWGGSGTDTGGRYQPATDSWTATATSGAPSGRDGHTAVWTGSEMIVWGGDDADIVTPVVDTGGRYHPATDSWTATTTAGVPSGRRLHTAVWTGSEMIVWGGFSGSPLIGTGQLNTGSRYDPATDRWTATAWTNAPSASWVPTAVWTGSEMIVWGGFTGSSALATGSRYHPATDSWTDTTLTGAPSARFFHTAVWTGSEMIVWGGTEGLGSLDSGARYNPAADSWTPTTTSGAPSAIREHTAVWTGSEMIVWGGSPATNAGGRYHPATNSWTPTTTTGAPSARDRHTAIWTGSEMIVWGGTGVGDGGRYRPATDAWSPVATSGAPSARDRHTAIWTGSEMVIWGGSPATHTGGRYHPTTDSWTATTTTGAPSARAEHTAVWTGSEMIVWGGDAGTGLLASGGRYDPASDGWSATSTTGAPSARDLHAAVWTGEEMIVFGGCCGQAAPAIYYPYGTDGTSTTITADLPDPSVVGEAVTIEVAVAGNTTLPTAGQVTITASSGESCTDTTASAGTGTTALFSCSITFVTTGTRNLTAVYSGSSTHDGSTSTAEPHEVVALPSLSINDVSAAEGNSGSTAFVFTITRSHTLNAVSVQVDTANGTATAGSDYTAISAQTLTLPAGGAATATLTVNVSGDSVLEADESFFVNLSNVLAATLSDGQGLGTIRNDDTASIAINSVSLPEGSSGTTGFTFTATLTGAVQGGFTVPVSSVDGSAVAPADYIAIPAGTSLSFAGSLGETQTITVQVIGDTLLEPNESFSVMLGTPSNGHVAVTTAIGIGTILDDDQQPTTTVITGRTPSSTVVGQPYTVNVTVTAQTLSPTGSVTISDGSASCTAPLTTGTAPASSMSCSLTSTTAGTKTLTASYTPDSGAFATSSGTVSHPVTAAATTISVSGPARSRINQPTSFSFALAVTSPGAGTPTGTVTLSSGAASCTATLPATSCDLVFDTLGARTVTASYAGDGHFAASTSSALPTLVFALADVSITKTDGEATYQPGDLIVYTVQVRNAGPDAAAQVRVQDIVPAGLSAVTWTCDASGGAVCSPSSGTGNLDVTLASMPVGALWNYTFYGTVTGLPEQIVNTATLTLPADATIEDPNPGNNSATDISVLESLFANGFEALLVNGPEGSARLPTAALAAVLDEVARIVVRLEDKRGEMARVYARLHLGAVEYALATRGADGRWTLGPWTGYAVDPTLSWNAELTAGSWRLTRVEMR